MSGSDKDKILDKIKKCLALSASSNEHEAKAALRQAQKLMEQHGITAQDVQAADAEERLVKAGATKTPARWEAYLAARVCVAFGCRSIFQRGLFGRSASWCFIGCVPNTEIAEYAFKVLLRQCRRARKDYISKRLRRCKPANKTRRADVFCESWVSAVTELIQAFAATPEQQRAIEAYMQKHHPNLQSLKSRSRTGDKLTSRDYSDCIAGHEAGRKAELHRGVNGTERKGIGAGEEREPAF